MQVNLPSEPAARPASGPRAILLPDITQLLESGTASRTRREQDLDQVRDERLRRKDSDNEELVAAAGSTPRSSDVIVKAERRMLSGTQAARHEQLRSQAREQVSQDNKGFRRVLADATARGKDTPTQSAAAETPAPASDTDQDVAAKPQPVDTGLTKAPGSKGAEPAQQAPAQPATEANAAPWGNVRPPVVTVSTFGGPTEAGGISSPVDAAQAATKVSAVSEIVRNAAAPTPTANPESTGGAAPTTEATQGAASSRRAAKSPAPSGESEARGSSDVNAERILRLIHTRMGKDRSVATLRLDPPELGKVTLHMDLRNDQMALRIDTETDAARRLLSEQMDSLRRDLHAAGIQLERVEVRAAEATRNDADANLPQHADVPAGHQETGQGTESNGEGTEAPRHEGTEARADDQGREWEGAGKTSVGPAAESLVNVWA